MILDSRPARIGPSINSRSEKHGEEDVPAMDVPIIALMLTKAELNALMRDRTIWDRWFNERKDKLPEPANRNLKPYGLRDKYEHSTARILVGLDNDRVFAFNDCDLSKISLTPQVGGLTELHVTIQALINDSNTSLFEFMAKDCSVELSFGDLEKEKKKNANQPELNLDARGDEAEPKPKRTRAEKINGDAPAPPPA